MSRRTSKVLVCLVSILLCLANRPTIAQSLVNFHPLVSYASGGWSSEQVAVADFNSDGKLDAVISNACASGSVSGSCLGNTGSVSVFLGNGDGTFQPEVSYDSGGSFTYAVTVADVNRDGKADIIATNYCASNTDCTHGTVAVLLGNGDGTFHTAQEFGTGGAGAVSSAVADFNSDGIPDIVVANNCLVGPPPSQVACQPGSIGVLLGNGDGSFQPATSIPFGYYPLWVGVGDLNGDHQPDLVVTDLGCGNTNCPKVSVFLGNADGSFQAPMRFTSGADQQPYYGAIADLNGDGKADIVVPNYLGTVAVLLGNGDGTFQPAALYGTGGVYGGFETYSVSVADLNRDGKPDLVATNGSGTSGSTLPGTIGVLLGNGDGSFQPATTFGLAGNGTVSVATRDLNGDALPDIILGTEFADIIEGANGSIGVLINAAVVTISGSPQQPLTRDSQGHYVANVTITNTGNVAAGSLQVTVAGTTIGAGSLISAPTPISNLAPGASAVVNLTFPSNSVPPGTKIASLKVSGTYSAVTNPLLSGNWALSFRRVTL